MTRGEGGRGWISVKEHSLSDYLKRADVNSDKVLNVFVKHQELIAEQKKKRLDGWLTNHHMSSIRQELRKKARAAGNGYKQDITRKGQKAYSWQR